MYEVYKVVKVVFKLVIGVVKDVVRVELLEILDGDLFGRLYRVVCNKLCFLGFLVIEIFEFLLLDEVVLFLFLCWNVDFIFLVMNFFWDMEVEV